MFSGTEDSWILNITSDGTPVYSTFRRSSVTGWSVAIGVPRKFVDTPLRRVWMLAVGGGIAIRFSGGRQAWGWFLVDVAFFALAALAEEIAFRGYTFQRFSRAVGCSGSSAPQFSSTLPPVASQTVHL